MLHWLLHNVKMKWGFFAFLIIFLLFFQCGKTYADLPIPKPEVSSEYWKGVDTIYIRSYESINPQLIMIGNLGKSVPKIDHKQKAMDIAELLSSSLEQDKRARIKIKVFDDENISSFKNLNERSLLLSFSFGYSVENDGQIVGAVMPVMWRSPPSELTHDRVSGYQSDYTGIAPVPFLWNSRRDSQDIAVKKAVQELAYWLNKYANF